MRSLKQGSLWVGGVYFLILLGIAFWIRDIPNQPDAFSITLQQLIKTSWWSDPVYAATAAIDIAENGWISSANDWIFNLWPPGFVLLEALIIKVLGADAPMLLVLQILAAVLFSVVLVLLYELLKAHVKGEVAIMLPLLIFAFPVSRVFLLEPTGISLGESFAIGFFLLGVLLALRSVGKNQVRYALYAGLSLALSAYFRSQFELILLALTGWGILLVIALRFTRLRESIEPTLLRSIVMTIAVVLLVAHVATAPWRAYHWIYRGSPSWVETSNLVFENAVKTSERLKQDSGGFVLEGGGNLVCRIDPATCGDTANARRLFIKTFIEHPIEWFLLKFKVIGKYWYSSVINWASVRTESSALDFVTNGLNLVVLIALFVLLLTRKVRSHRLYVLLVWFVASIFSAYALIFTLVHFEVRYFYFPKIAAIFLVLVVASLYRQPVKVD